MVSSNTTKIAGIVETTPLLKVFDRYLGDGLHDPDNRLLVAPETGEVEPDEAEQSTLTGAVSDLFSE